MISYKKYWKGKIIETFQAANIKLKSSVSEKKFNSLNIDLQS